MTLIILFAISVFLNVLLFWLGWKKVIQNEQLIELNKSQTERLDFTEERITELLEKMRAIDIRGSFESDDEVGATFQGLKALIEQYKEEES